MESRVSALAAALAAERLDAYYCRRVSDIRWLTGFEGVFDSEAAHLALVMGESVLIHTDGRYSTAMRRLADGTAVSIDDAAVRHPAFAAGVLAEADGEEKLRIGIERDIPLDEYRSLVAALDDAGLAFELVELASPVALLRAVKDDLEFETMRRAQEITDRCFDDLLGWVAPGMTELQVANEMEYRMRSFGASGLAFPTIVASGFHSAMPHAIPSEKPLEAGDLVVLDFGARYGDYCSDMTRTIVIGEPTDEQRRIYDTTLRAHEECKAMIAPGVGCAAVHEHARQVIDDGGYPGCFTHGLGHGVGIDVHEEPGLNARNNGSVLVAGNVVTVEPGIYVPGVGGVRIEDCGVVTVAGFESFASSPRNLISI